MTASKADANSAYRASLSMLVSSGEFDGRLEPGRMPGHLALERIFNYSYAQVDTTLLINCCDEFSKDGEFHRKLLAYLLNYRTKWPPRSYQEKMVDAMISCDDPVDGLYRAVMLQE